jgi:hypothetical protein
MTVRSTYRKRRILPGFLVVLLVFLGQTTATPTHSAPSIISAISNVGYSLNSGSWYEISSPQSPLLDRDTLCGIIDNENDDDPHYKSIPVHAVDHYLFEHTGTTNRNSHPTLPAIASGNSYHLTTIYMLTERFRL